MEEHSTLVGLQHYIEVLLKNERELTQQRFESMLRAVDKAEQTMNARLEGMNEFRRQLESQEMRYVQRAVLDELMRTMDIRLTTLERASNIMTGKTAMLWAIIVIGLSLLGIAVKVLL